MYLIVNLNILCGCICEHFQYNNIKIYLTIHFSMECNNFIIANGCVSPVSEIILNIS